MNSRQQFVESRAGTWTRLEQLIERGRAGRMRHLSGDEVLEFGELYRSASADLAVARRDMPGDDATRYLNGLVSRAHAQLYGGKSASVATIAGFVRYGFPAVWRQTGPYIAVAFGLFLAAALISAALVTWRQSMADVLMPGQAQALRAYMEQHHLWVKGAAADSPLSANFIMLNNIQVAFVAFAGGMLLGLLTVYAMIQNGLMLGTTAAMVHHYGLSEQLWSFVIGHGVIELSVIFMAGGAGLLIGDAILRPGLMRRRDALERAAKQGALLIFGCIPLLMIAGTIEGFLSPSAAPDTIKFLVGGTSGILLYSYLLLSGRARGRHGQSPFAVSMLNPADGDRAVASVKDGIAPSPACTH